MMPGEFTLQTPETFLTLPAPTAWMRTADDHTHGLDRMSHDYPQGRPLSDFRLTKEDLERIGMMDQELQHRLYTSSHVDQHSKTALVLDIGFIIEAKKRGDSTHPNFCTTKEVLEGMDGRGYRPAGLIDLLIFAKTLWKPELEDEMHVITEQERVEQVNAKHIFALGAVFSDAKGNRLIPFLDWTAAFPKRYLGAATFEGHWVSSTRLLVICGEA